MSTKLVRLEADIFLLSGTDESVSECLENVLCLAKLWCEIEDYPLILILYYE